MAPVSPATMSQSLYRAGVVHGMPGLYFCGLIFQYSFASMVFPGIGRDAAYVARQVAARAGAAKQAVAV